MKVDQARQFKELQKENARLQRAVANLTLDKLILEEAAKGNFCAPSADAGVWCRCVSDWGRRTWCGWRVGSVSTAIVRSPTCFVSRVVGR